MKIEIIDKGYWMYFWVKTIESVDLNNHCAKSFIGKYLHGNLIKTTTKNVYICGVSKPFIYKNNLHIALKEKIGHNFTIKEKGVIINIYDAERIEVKSLIKGQAKNINSNKIEYYTCRNWQYANQITE